MLSILDVASFNDDIFTIPDEVSDKTVAYRLPN